MQAGKTIATAALKAKREVFLPNGTQRQINFISRFYANRQFAATRATCIC